ncbi:hypothetical protein EV128_12318 [Rhizobium azibense]|nr:hypothetical protein EV128_12318 [Rhizobium azibense]
MTDIHSTSVVDVILRKDRLSVISILFVAGSIALSLWGHGRNEPGEGNAVLSIAPKASISAP